MAITTRKEAREALGALLTTEMAGAGNPVEAVYDYGALTFEGKSPALTIESGGTRGNPFTAQGLRPTYFFGVVVYVSRGGGEKAAQDELDEVAQKLYRVVEANRRTGDWQSLSYTDRSIVAPVTVGGDPYWMEVTPVEMEVF